MPFTVDKVKRHLIRFGRSPRCCTWRGPQDPDSFDEEWESDFTEKIAKDVAENSDHDRGLQMRQLMKEMYQQVDEVAERENQLNDIAMEALHTVDDITGINQGDIDLPTEQDMENAGVEADLNTGRGTNEGCDGNDQPQNVHFNNIPDVTGGLHNSANSNLDLEAETESLEAERSRDAKSLEDAMCLLYSGSSVTKLGLTSFLKFAQ